MEIKNYNDGKQVPATTEEKKVEAVVHSKGTRKRNKFLNSVISEEAGNIKNYILLDVLIPALKKTIDEIVTNGKDIILWGEAGHSKKSSGSKVSYVSYYDDNRRWRERNESNRYRSAGYDYDDLVFESRGEAEIVLDNLYGILDRYNRVTVADLYDLADAPSRYTDNKYGWTNLSTATVVRIRDGYVIKLPRATAID